MDYREFAKKIKAKYPDYSDMDDLDLARRMVAKYPDDYSDIEFGSGTESIASRVEGAAAKAFPVFGAARGMARGFTDKPESADATIAERAGRMAGENPALLGTALAGTMTGGLGLLPAAAATGTIAGGAEAFGQIGRRALGAKAPETPEEAAKKIGLEASKAAASELAVLGSLKVGEKFLRATAQGLVGISPRNFQRVLERYNDSPIVRKFLTSGPESRSTITGSGIKALSNIQDKIETARNIRGRAVENALNGLAAKTGNQPVADITDAIAGARQFLDQPGVDINSGLGAKVKGLLDEMIADSARPSIELGVLGEKNLVPIKTLVSYRRRIDAIGDFARKSLGDADRDVANAVARSLGGGLRQSIAKTANEFKHTQLLKANADFSEFSTIYDDLSGLFGAKGRDIRSMKSAFDRAAKDFGGGDILGQRILEAKRIVPQAAKDIDDLVDAAAVRGFSSDPLYTPSSDQRALFRQLASPKRVGGALEVLMRLKSAVGIPASGAVAASERIGRK